MLGDMGVGKTTLLTSFIKDGVVGSAVKATTAADFSSKEIVVGNTRITL